MPVVVGSVATREGRAAVRRAAQEAVLRSTCLVVVAAARRLDDEPDADALRGVLNEAAEALDAAGLELVHADGAGQGDVAEDLVTVAAEHEADCIVIGLRKRSPVGKLILGSNAQRILLDAHCPVIAVKAGPAD